MDGLMNPQNVELCDQIIKVAGELFIQQGFEKTSMGQIAAGSAISLETLYNCFPVKEAVAAAYFREIFQGITRATWESLPKLPDSGSRLTAIISNIYEWAELNPDLVRVVIFHCLKSLGTCQIFEDTGTRSIIAEILHRGRAAGELRDDIPWQMVLAYIDNLASTILLDWLKNNGQGNLRGQVGPMVDLIFFGIPSQPGT